MKGEMAKWDDIDPILSILSNRSLRLCVVAFLRPGSIRG